MDDAEMYYNRLAKKIVRAQKQLEKKSPKNELLDMVEINDIGIRWKSEFGERYNHMNADEALNQYILDLENYAASK